MRVCVFDLETRKHARELNPEDESAGWDALRRGEGGVSVIAIYDSADQWVHLYDDHTSLGAARHLERADLVVGYCSERFDLPCLEGLVGRRLALRDHIDLYTMIAEANAARGRTQQAGDYKLDPVCKRTIGRGKNDHGAHAPELARQGRWAQLFAYCMNDVRLTRDLFDYAIEHGGVINVDRTFLTLPIPEWIRVGAAKERTA
jgi:DEAD/DEAH box helicase domain-containing protein